MQVTLNSEHYKAVLEDLPNGLYIVDRDRRILFWNRGAEQITGYRSQEVIGHLCQDNLLMHCDENYKMLCGCNCPLQQTMVDGRPRETNVYLRHKDGQRIPVRVRAVPVRNAEGAIIGAAESFDERHDIPELQMHPNAQAVQKHADERTGVSDEASTRDYLAAALRDYQEDGIPFGVLMIAIDEFDRFRRAHGGEVVAKLLHMIGVTVAKNLRDADFVGDWGESCFLAIVVNCPPANLAQLIFMLKRVVSVAEIPWWGERVAVTVSIGGAAVHPADTVHSLVARAELAMRRCMDHGGNSGDIL